MTSIGVVITTHNRPDMLARALASVAAQTRQPDATVVIDDASPTPVTVASHDVLVVRQHERQGVCAARNLGLEMISTELVTFLDDDDVLAPTFLELQVDGIAGSALPPPVAAIGSRVFRGGDGVAVRRHMPRSIERGSSWLEDPVPMVQNSLVAPTAALRLLNGFDRRFEAWEHEDLFERLLTVCALQAVPNAEYASDMADRPERLTKDYRRLARGIDLTLSQHGAVFARNRGLRASYCRASADYWLRSGERSRACSQAIRAVLATPRDRRNYVALGFALTGGGDTVRRMRAARQRRLTSTDR
jgi:glycosyltransferase involved in cell wall biosynthesis